MGECFVGFCDMSVVVGGVLCKVGEEDRVILVIGEGVGDVVAGWEVL